MTNNETYNGWTNRETWAFMLHVNNDQGLQELVHDDARVYLDADEPNAGLAGERAVEYVLELLDEGDLGELGRMVQRDVGSFWRIDYAEVGASILEDLA